MMAEGEWMDTVYAACALYGARAKQQRLRHNCTEMQQWPMLECRHMHDPKEWRHKGLLNKDDVLPSKVEAEYTATLCFMIAVSATWCVTRRGVVAMAIPRLPKCCCVGDRRGWKDMDPRVTREWAMVPVALSCGINVSLQNQVNQVVLPTRANAGELGLVIRDKKVPQLGEDHIYIGQGHHRHRLKCTKWASKYTPGLDGSNEECLYKYRLQLEEGKLLESIHELYGKVLVCDEDPAQVSPADVLISECYVTLQQQ